MNLPAGSRMLDGSRPAAAAHKRQSGRSPSLRGDPSTIMSPASRSCTQISRGVRGAIGITPTRNHSPPRATGRHPAGRRFHVQISPTSISNSSPSLPVVSLASVPSSSLSNLPFPPLPTPHPPHEMWVRGGGRGGVPFRPGSSRIARERRSGSLSWRRSDLARAQSRPRLRAIAIASSRLWALSRR